MHPEKCPCATRFGVEGLPCQYVAALSGLSSSRRAGMFGFFSITLKLPFLSDAGCFGFGLRITLGIFGGNSEGKLLL